MRLIYKSRISSIKFALYNNTDSNERNDVWKGKEIYIFSTPQYRTIEIAPIDIKDSSKISLFMINDTTNNGNNNIEFILLRNEFVFILRQVLFASSIAILIMNIGFAGDLK